jgi:hypothetical protein
MQIQDNEGLRQRVDDSVGRQKRLMHLIFFCVSLGMFVLFFALSLGMLAAADLPPELVQGDNAPVAGAFIMLSAGWFTSLIFQVLSLLADFGVMDASMRARAITRELGNRLYEQAAADYEKPKRQAEEDASQYAITDDGELVQVDEENQRKAAQGE